VDEETQGTEAEEEVEAHRNKVSKNAASRNADTDEAADVEAHRSRLPATDEPEGEDDDVEAHRNTVARNTISADDAADRAELQRNKTP